MHNEQYDVIIIGGGPAGLTAGLYTSRARLSSLLLEKGLMGGQITEAELVENYPGFVEGISGMEIGQLMHRQATKFGLKTDIAEVSGVELQGKQKVVKTNKGDFTCKALIIASGALWHKLGVPGEAEFTGKGVSYCATCDAPFFEEQEVAVVGGGDAAITEALHLAKFASKVTVIHRRDQLRATRILQERAFAEPRIAFAWSSTVDEIEGNDILERLKLNQVKTGEKYTLDVAGVFVAIGIVPNTSFLQGILPLDDTGHIIVNEKMETEIPGVFAGGDVRTNSGRQVICAAGDGATAAIYSQKFIGE